MIQTSNKQDLASLRQVFLILQQVIENPEKFEIVNFEAEQGTSRTELPSAPGEHAEHAVQRLGISIVYTEKLDG